MPVDTRSHPNTVMCPTSIPHSEKTPRLVRTSRTSGSTALCLHRKLPCFPWTSKPNTRVTSSSHFGSLQIKPNWSSFALTCSDDTISSYTKISPQCTDILSFTFSSWDSTVLIIAFIICDATFSPKPRPVRQYLLLANITVWNGHRIRWPRPASRPFSSRSNTH